jgi:hypothetical protein
MRLALIIVAIVAWIGAAIGLAFWLAELVSK